MAVIVETGAGVPNANSYLSVDDFKAYAAARGLDIAAYADLLIEQALVRATTWLDVHYRNRWPGVRTYGGAQTLQWPRKGGSIYYGVHVASGPLLTVVDAEGLAIAIDAIPTALKNALAEATYRELVEPGTLAPDLERGGQISSISAGSVSIQFAGGAPATTVFSLIDGLIADILAAPRSTYTAQAVRA